MIQSRFNVEVESFPGPGKHLIYNTRSQAQVVIDGELREILARLPSSPAKPEAAQALTQLEKMGFVVADARADDAALERFFARVRSDNTVLKPTVLTTYACNFACTYCVEQGVRRGAPMSEEMATRVVEYIILQFRTLASREILLTFYGGEPLLNLRAVRLVARSLKAFTDGCGAGWGFHLSTNGSLLTPEVIGELVPLGMRGAKITLDGPGAIHDHTRPFGNGKGSFDTLVRNIEAAVDMTSIVIEVNFGRENVASIPVLLDFLVERGLERKISRLLFMPISETPQDVPARGAAPERTCASLAFGASDELIRLQAVALERGFPVNTAVTAQVCEMLSKRSSFIIDPDGRLYRCGGLAGRSEFSFGTIDGPENDRWLGTDGWRRCAGCVYAPLCGDGCPFGSYVTWGDPWRLVCRKEEMERVVREGLKATYLRKNGKQAR